MVKGWKLILFLVIISMSCNKKNEIKYRGNTKNKFDSGNHVNLPGVFEREFFERDLFSKEPKIEVERSFFSAKFIDEGRYNNGEQMRFRFRTEINCNFTKETYWVREYYITDSTMVWGLNDSLIVREYRFYNSNESANYLIGECIDAFYIKWKNRKISQEVWYSDEIGKNTYYLETNLTEEIIKKYFKQVACSIIIKHPKSIRMQFGDFFPLFNHPPYEKREKIQPLLSF